MKARGSRAPAPPQGSISSLPQECRGLGNFSSLHTILFALQSPTITRFQDTWGQVSRESCRNFKKWCRREQRVNRELLMQHRQEATSVLVTAERACQGTQERQQQQGVVPSMVTFFSSLELLEATMVDYVEVREPGGECAELSEME
nr:ral guanine nucleotide dissociation stimulator-like isoform X3 [Equus asinus]